MNVLMFAVCIIIPFLKKKGKSIVHFAFKINGEIVFIFIRFRCLLIDTPAAILRVVNMSTSKHLECLQCIGGTYLLL